MLDVLLESRGVRTPRPLIEAMLSAIAHGALAVLIVIGPSLANRYDDSFMRKPIEQITLPEYLVPPDKSGPPREEHLRFMANGGAESPVAASDAPTLERESAIATNDDRAVAATPRARLADDAYSVLDVDSAAVRDPSSAAPAYPPAMMNLAIEGAATIRFVVDTTGMVDLGTVKTENATNPAFEHAVLDALPRMRFRPARIGAKAVRQTSSQEFKFQLTRLAVARP